MKEVPTNVLWGKKLIIDGDILRYKCGFAMEKVDAKPKELPEFIDVTINSIRRISPNAEYEIWLSGPHNFREIIATIREYKGNRKGLPKPKFYKEIGEYLTKTYHAQWTRGYEADDALAILLTEDPRGRVLVSNDKDFRQVSGWHYNWVTNTAFWISRKAGDFNLYTQLLAGDPTDNIQGIEGIGPKKAKEILAGASCSAELCQRAWNAYRVAGLSRDQFIETARLVYLLRRFDDELPKPFYLDQTYAVYQEGKENQGSEARDTGGA